MFQNTSFKPRTPLHDTPNNIVWWVQTLSHNDILCIVPGIEPILDVSIFSDASSAISIGIIISNRWRAWTLVPGWNQQGRCYARGGSKCQAQHQNNL